MGWFPDRQATELWGGPRFRFPFDARTFREDCRLDQFQSYGLVDADDRLAAFGQIGQRHGRCHLARLVADPQKRGMGVGLALVRSLVETVKSTTDFDECGLFVYRHNAAAIACYNAAGFRVTGYPKRAPMAEECYYMVRELR